MLLNRTFAAFKLFFFSPVKQSLRARECKNSDFSDQFKACLQAKNCVTSS